MRFELPPLPPSLEGIRARAEWERHDLLTQQLEALRAPRLMIFVDTNNVHLGYYQTLHIDLKKNPPAEPPKLDPVKLLDHLVDFPRHRLIRAYWYDAEVGKGSSLYEVQQSLHGAVRGTAFCDLTLGEHTGERQERREKGVDIALAVDMLEHAFRDNYDTAILCSGDSDFVPLVRAVKATGKHVMCSSYTCTLSQDKDILESIDYFIPLDGVDLTWAEEEETVNEEEVP